MKRIVAFSALALALGLTVAASAAPPPDLALSAEDRAALVAAFAPAGRSAPAEAESDAGLWSAVEDLARTELGQRLRPSEIDPLWAEAAPVRSIGTEMVAAWSSGRLAEWAANLSPRAPAYAALMSARLRYAGIVQRGGWAPLPDGLRLRPGDVGDPVLALRQRLEIEGDAPPPAERPERFDRPLKQALAGWQARNGLSADGVLGPVTLARLNVPAAERLGQIEANLERWRWLPRPLPQDRLEIDTGGANGVLYRAGQPVHAFRVIVGSVRDPTPLFTSQVHSLVLNPPWNVPERIAREELLPREASEPGYLARNGFIQLEGRLQQTPGPMSALGQVKFDLNSPFGVYLHDTPGRAAFRLSERHLSHGCMRVDKPLVLADLLLAPRGRDGAPLRADLATGQTLRVALARPVALVVTHWTVRVEPDGQVGFLDDVYGWDARLALALSGM
ncbi:MAG: L,D-transpeptidase family protein [Phenylobacterium sp.]